MKNKILTLILITTQLTISAQLAITIPTEFEKSERLLMTWPYNDHFDSVVANITSIVQSSAIAEIIYNPDNNAYDTSSILQFLHGFGADTNAIILTPGYTNTNLLRQYSPVTGYGVMDNDLERYLGNPGFNNHNRPKDDSIPMQLSDNWNMDVVDYGLEFENSNIQYDGLRYLFAFDKIIDDNYPMSENDIKFSLNSYFNSDVIVFLQTPVNSGGGTLGGIENYIKYLDFETIAITSLPDTAPDYLLLEEIANTISNLSNYFGSNYKIIRLPAAPNSDGTYATEQNQTLRSYTNSVIINNIIIIPSYGSNYYDSLAYNKYSNAMPGYNIFQINAEMLADNHSGLHTITKEIPQPDLLRILHEKKTGIQEYFPEIKINSLCIANTLIESMWLYYKINDDTAYTKTQIHLVCPQHFAIIDKVQPTDTISYYIEANSSYTTTTYPLSAPEGNFTFWFDVTTNTNEDEIENEISIYPNPAKNSIRINGFNNNAEDIRVSLINSTGQKVFDETYSIGSSINLQNNIKSGIYMIIIEQGNETTVDKLIILP